MISIILAGGSGTRFWPLSRRRRPKQLVRLFGDAVLLAQTVQRVAPLDHTHDPLVVCGLHLVDALADALPSLPRQNFLIEPAARNTAPAIALAASHVAHHHGEDTVLGVFPSDHAVTGHDAFTACVQRAADDAALGHIVTLGIPPTRPETGYGYIRLAEQPKSTPEAPQSVPVSAFVEKPDADTARAYLDAGSYVWNSGVFLFTPATLFAEYARQRPSELPALDALRAAVASEDRDALPAAFSAMEATSFDYAIMEGAASVRAVPATFMWSDVGHWAALPEVLTPDADGNITRGPVVTHETTSSIVYATDPSRVVAVAGASDLIVVDTEDAVLVVPKARAQEVKALVEALKRAGFEGAL
ncbi:MAG: sugar phosphate nucleotidyltransferase [Myxococcota bacterium]